jgi:hypothetical protein
MTPLQKSLGLRIIALVALHRTQKLSPSTPTTPKKKRPGEAPAFWHVTELSH